MAPSQSAVSDTKKCSAISLISPMYVHSSQTLLQHTYLCSTLSVHFTRTNLVSKSPKFILSFEQVRCNSATLTNSLAKSIKEFSIKLKQKQIKKGVITLEFYSKKAKILPMLSFSDNHLIWEQWIIKINCGSYSLFSKRDSSSTNPFKFLPSNLEKSKDTNNENLPELLLEKLRFIINLANNHSLYTPDMPAENSLDSCFNCTHPDVLPYLYRVNLT